MEEESTVVSEVVESMVVYGSSYTDPDLMSTCRNVHPPMLAKSLMEAEVDRVGLHGEGLLNPGPLPFDFELAWLLLSLATVGPDVRKKEEDHSPDMPGCAEQKSTNVVLLCGGSSKITDYLIVGVSTWPLYWVL